MTSKKLIVLAIFLVGLLAVGAVSAADNSTGDIVGMDDSTDAIGVQSNSTQGVTNDNDDFEVGEGDTPLAQTNNEEIISADSETSPDSVVSDSREAPKLESDGQDILGDKPVSWKKIQIDDVNIHDYFTSGGDIIPNTLAAGDTIIFGNLNDKTLNIDIPLIITSDGTEINENTINLKPGSDNSIIEGLFMANDFTNAINVVGANNISIVKNVFSFYSLGRDNHLSAITADSAFNLTIAENKFKYIGKDDNDGKYNSNTIIKIIDSDIVEIINNTILFDSKSVAASASDRAIKISDSNYLVISGNKIAAAIPSREISWATGQVYSECVCLEGCKNITFAKNAIGVASSGSTGDYGTIYGVYIVGEDVAVYDNAIDVGGAPYGYGLVLSAENFKVFANRIFTGINLTGIMDGGSSNLFNSKNYFDIGNFMQAYEKLANYYGGVKGNLKSINQDALTPYACSLEIDGKSRGAIEFNLIGAAADSSYGIYTANWAGDVQTETAFNLILGVGNSAFGMSLTGSEALVKYSLISMLGNFTTGIASSVSNINITHNAIHSQGSNEGKPLGYDMMGIETTGVHIVSGTASITKNIINTTGECAVDFADNGRVTENRLFAGVYTGDASVNYDPEVATVRNNTPKMQKIKIYANDVEASYGETIKCYVKLTDYGGFEYLAGILVQLGIGNDNFTNKTDENGVATFDLGKLDAGSHDVTIMTITNSSYVQATKTIDITVSKLKTKLTAKAITATYNVNKYLVITLKDSNNDPVSGVKVSIGLKGVKYYVTDKNGRIKVPTKGLAPKTYKAKINFSGNKKYVASSTTAKVTVKKATPKMTAKAKKFKKKTKIKKYTIRLKDNKGKAIKKAKVTLKVKGKTYKAKTNSKGKATFKITKLIKKGKYKAVITYKGNKYYKKLSKKVKLTVKSG